MKKSKLNLYLSLMARRSRRFVFSQTKGLLITGLFVVIPIFVTLWVAWFIYNLLTTWALAIIKHLNIFQDEIGSFWVQQGIRVISLILIVVLLIAIGQLARMTLGNRMITLAQKILLPACRSLISSIPPASRSATLSGPPAGEACSAKS